MLNIRRKFVRKLFLKLDFIQTSNRLWLWESIMDPGTPFMSGWISILKISKISKTFLKYTTCSCKPPSDTSQKYQQFFVTSQGRIAESFAVIFWRTCTVHVEVHESRTYCSIWTLRNSQCRSSTFPVFQMCCSVVDPDPHMHNICRIKWRQKMSDLSY